MVFGRLIHRIRSGRQEASQSSTQDSEKGSDTAIGSSSDVKLSQLDLEISSESYIPHVQTTVLTEVISRESLGSESFGEARSYDEDGFLYEDEDPNLDENVVRVEDDSPYPEVRAAVANTDDPDMPCSTVRSWTLGLICAIIMPGLNQFMYFRYPSVAVGPLVAQLLSFPAGRLWARFVPQKTLFGLKLNPGPFTIKEHVIVTIMAGVGGQSAYATDIIAVQRVYYDQGWSFIYQWMLVMSTQLIGFSIGGVDRRFLVESPSMIWPANLVLCALFNTLHSQQYVGIGPHGGVSRERFFSYALLIATVYYFLPGYLFSALSMFTWVCWIAPENGTFSCSSLIMALKQMFGYQSGLGMSMITFDWSQIAYIGSPLATPWWAAVNITVGFVFFFWIVTPILYFKNVWNSQFMPIMSRFSYDNTGQQYNVSRILTPEATLDYVKYKEYSPLYLPTAFAIAYGLSFASITATIMHTILYFRKQIYYKARGAFIEQPDIHARLMMRYKPVPQSWYIIVFLTMFAAGIISIEVWDTQMPVWALVLALVIALVYIIPIGMIQAITNQQIGLNVITELVVGYALPGKPIAMMLFKTFGYISMSQALRFSSDFKLGHYMKVPPIPMFWCQVVATVVAGTVQLGVQAWMFANIPDMCALEQKDLFICPDTQVFFTASVVWGVIGPALQFSKGQTYYALMFFFLLGAVLPLIPWMYTKRYPNSFMKYTNVPLILGGTGLIPPATANNYVPWAIVAFIFQYVIRRHYFAWWAKYNYVLSAALDSSVAFGALIIYFSLEAPMNSTLGNTTIGTWWGNTVYMNTADWRNAPLQKLLPNRTFGPLEW